jgi:hypothetical protein
MLSGSSPLISGDVQDVYSLEVDIIIESILIRRSPVVLSM